MKKISIQVNSNITPNMVQLILALEEAGFINDGYLVYQEEQEPSVKEIFDKYEVTL